MPTGIISTHPSIDRLVTDLPIAGESSSVVVKPLSRKLTPDPVTSPYHLLHGTQQSIPEFFDKRTNPMRLKGTLGGIPPGQCMVEPIYDSK